MQPYAYSILASVDYTNTTADLRLGPSSRTQCVLIPLINDMVPEPPEQFRVMLAMATPLPGIILTPDIATIVINDDDGKCEWLCSSTKITVLSCSL